MNTPKKLRDTFEDLSNKYDALYGAFAEEQKLTRQVVGGNTEVIGALVSLFGPKLVEDEMNRLRSDRRAKREQQEKDGVTELVAAGVLTPAEVVAENGFLVGVEVHEGDARRVQFETNNIFEAQRPKYYGLTVGGTVDDEGTSFTVTEIYSIDRAAAEVFNQEQAAKQIAAQAAAATPAVETPAETV